MTEERAEKEQKRTEEAYEIAESWIGVNMEVILGGQDFEVLGASPFHDFISSGTGKPEVGFRARVVERSHHNGDEVREITFRAVGKTGHHEFDNVMRRGLLDYAATIWMSELTVAAGVIVDMNAVRALPGRVLKRMETHGGRPLPFKGFPVPALVAHGCVKAMYPDEDYFMGFVKQPMPGQASLL